MGGIGRIWKDEMNGSFLSMKWKRGMGWSSDPIGFCMILDKPQNSMTFNINVQKYYYNTRKKSRNSFYFAINLMELMLSILASNDRFEL